MSLFSVFDITGSAMSAQSVRMNLTASNIANAQSLSSSDGEVYQARHPIFVAKDSDFSQSLSSEMSMFSGNANGAGVEVREIVESQRAGELRYEPDHPMADEKGYVQYPNVNIMEEMANMISASRSFQTNVDALETTTQMMERLLALGKG